MRSSGLNPNQYSRSSLTEDSFNLRFFITFFMYSDNLYFVFSSYHMLKYEFYFVFFPYNA